MSDLQFAVDAAQSASYNARKANERLTAIEGALILLLRGDGWSLRSIRDQFPYLTLRDIKKLIVGETP